MTARRNTTEGTARTEAVTSILDAAEALLIAEGHRAVTTRRLSEQAGVNHGLVHYYFGSMDEVMMQTFERFTARLIVRQRAMYAADVPFLQKWRIAMGFLDEDLAAGYPKVWMELQALGWNRPEMRDRVAAMTAEWRGVLTEAFGKAAAEYHLDPDQFPVEALVSLVMTFNQGLSARAPVRHLRRPSRVAPLDRRLAGIPGGEEMSAEQSRARYPDAEDSSSGTASRSSTRSTATVGRRSCCSDLVDHPFAVMENADPVPRPFSPGHHIRPSWQWTRRTAR